MACLRVLTVTGIETPSWVRNPNTRRCVTRGGKRIVTPPIGLRTFAKKGRTYLLFTVRLDQNKRFAQVCGIAWRPIRSKFKGSFPPIDACIGLSSRVRRSRGKRIVTPPIGLRTFAKKECTYLLFTVRLDQNKRFAQVCGIAWRSIRSKFKGSFPPIDACIGLSSRVRRSSRSRPMPQQITDFRSCPKQCSKFVTTRVRLLS